MPEKAAELNYAESENPYDGQETINFIQYSFRNAFKRAFPDTDGCKVNLPLPTYSPETTVEELEALLQDYWGEHFKFHEHCMIKMTRSIGTNIDDRWDTIAKKAAEDGLSADEAANLLQADVDEYSVGVPRVATGGLKAKAKKLDELEKSAAESDELAGKSMAEIIEMAKKAAQAGVAE